MNDKAVTTILVLGTGIISGAQSFGKEPIAPIRIIVGVTALGTVLLAVAEFAPKLAVSFALLVFLTAFVTIGVPKRFTDPSGKVQ